MGGIEDKEEGRREGLEDKEEGGFFDDMFL